MVRMSKVAKASSYSVAQPVSCWTSDNSWGRKGDFSTHSTRRGAIATVSTGQIFKLPTSQVCYSIDFSIHHQLSCQDNSDWFICHIFFEYPGIAWSWDVLVFVHSTTTLLGWDQHTQVQKEALQAIQSLITCFHWWFQTVVSGWQRAAFRPSLL